MIYRSKLLPHLLYPTAIILFLLIWAVVSKRCLPTLLALLLFLISSSPILSNQMIAYIDGQEPKKFIEDFNAADSIVVSSEMISPIMTNQGIGYEWKDPERFFWGG